MGRGANLRLDDQMAAPGPGLRASHRRIKGHDSRRHGGQSHAQERSPVIFQTGSNSLVKQSGRSSDRTKAVLAFSLCFNDIIHSSDGRWDNTLRDFPNNETAPDMGYMRQGRQFVPINPIIVVNGFYMKGKNEICVT